MKHELHDVTTLGSALFFLQPFEGSGVIAKDSILSPLTELRVQIAATIREYSFRSSASALRGLVAHTWHGCDGRTVFAVPIAVETVRGRCEEYCWSAPVVAELR
jgi:hypothetical protein